MQHGTALGAPSTSLHRIRARCLEQARLRLFVLGSLFVLVGLLISGQLTLLALSGTDLTPWRIDRAMAQTSREMTEPAPRPNILDRHGNILATTLPVKSLYANPQDILDAEEATAKLDALFPEIGSDRLLARLSSNRVEVPIKRDLTPTQARAVLELGLPGVYFRDDSERFYPYGRLVSHAVGYVGSEGEGLAGIERAIDTRKVEGEAVTLSLDIRVQDILRSELLKALGEFSAIGGAGLVVDLKTDEVLAAVSLPDFEPTDASARISDAAFNRYSLGVYELGSVFKVLTAAVALDSGKVRLDDAFDARKPLRIGRHSIRDFKPEGRWLSVPEILVHSSNIGSAQMALATGTEAQKRFLDQLGLAEAMSHELPEKGTPLLPSNWGHTQTMTIAFGHGISVTPLHLAAAVGSVINDGHFVSPTFCKAEATCLGSIRQEKPQTRLISPQTSENVRRIMRAVVAASPVRDVDPKGYVLGGKTGTAEKAGTRGYGHEGRIASFVGAFPMTEPRYLVFVMVDEPHGTEQTYGYATGGWVAAPVVGRVVARLGPLLGVPPVLMNEEQLATHFALPDGARSHMMPSENDPFVFERRNSNPMASLASY